MLNNGQPFTTYHLSRVYLAFISGSKGVKLILLHKSDSFKRQISIPQIYNRHPKRMITELFAMQ